MVQNYAGISLRHMYTGITIGRTSPQASREVKCMVGREVAADSEAVKVTDKARYGICVD